ncbi:MAG: DUF4834 family protein [Alistipes sp.]|nr:DUF4834 family protein [Alistipes sp.]
MNKLKLIFYALAAFVERNPVFCTLLLICAIAAPWLLKSVFTVILYIVAALLLVGLVMFGSMAWRIRSMRNQMRDRFGADNRAAGSQSGHRGASWGGFSRGRNEGDVKVHRTDRAREKRVSDNVGDYVDFEEVGDNDKH